MNLYEPTSTISISDNSNRRVLTGHRPHPRQAGDVLNGILELGLSGELRQPGGLQRQGPQVCKKVISGCYFDSNLLPVRDWHPVRHIEFLIEHLETSATDLDWWPPPLSGHFPGSKLASMFG